MSEVAFYVVIAVAAFLVAWVANGLVGLLSGEHPRDTRSLWLDVLCRMLLVLELGVIGRVLSAIGLRGWARKLVFSSAAVRGDFPCSWL